jgi:hypothetical protein
MGSLRKRWTFISLLACSWLACAIPIGNAAEYEVDGVVEQSQYKSDGTIRGVTERTPFTVYVRDCSWLIRTTQFDSTVKHSVSREKGSTNGHEIFELVVPEVGETGVGQSQARALMHGATVECGDAPVDWGEGYVASHLWLTFASQCYFAAQQSNSIIPVWNFYACANFYGDPKTEGKWNLLDGPGSLPSRVIYYEHNNPGVVQASYNISGRTNVGATVLPLECVFEQFENPAAGRAGKTLLHRRAQIRVTAVRPFCSRASLVPTLLGLTLVNDYRLKDQGTKQVGYETREWLSISNVLQIQREQRDRAEAEYGRIMSNVVRTTALFDPWPFIASDFPSPPYTLARKLVQGADPVSKFIWSQLPTNTQVLLTDYQAKTPTMDGKREKPVLEALVLGFDRIVQGEPIYAEERFRGVQLKEDTIQLLKQNPSGAPLHHLNRMLLEDTYSTLELRKSLRTVTDTTTGNYAVVDYKNMLVDFYDKEDGRLSSADFGAYVTTLDKAWNALGSGHDDYFRSYGMTLDLRGTNCDVGLGKAFYQIDPKTGAIQFRASD